MKRYFVSPKGQENWTEIEEKLQGLYNPRQYDHKIVDDEPIVEVQEEIKEVKKVNKKGKKA